jgi:uncharacterized protein
MKKIAIIGSGISGLTAAYYLHKQHDICVYEADSRLGGHTATKDINIDGQTYAIDTGFIVFNDWTYPNFIRLIDELGVESQPTDMGFSVSNPLSGYEYAGTNLGTLFAQKRNLFSISHWRMLRDIVRFNKAAVADLNAGNLLPDETLGQYLMRNNYSSSFIHHYLIPMGSAIWSATQEAMLAFPLEFFVRFFNNHGLLNVVNRPQWRVIKGGSRSYIAPLTRGFADKIKLNCPVARVTRDKEKVAITANNQTDYFDEVIFACHSDQALALLGDASDDERDILGAIPYQKNSVVLHTDISLLPRNRSTWSSWNYRLQNNNTRPPVLTYSMNILQGIRNAPEFCVTLNATELIDPQKILGSYEYSHPVFSRASVAAQAALPLINGINRSWYCGAWCANGFHEDGVSSALRVVQLLSAGSAQSVGELHRERHL